MADSAGEKTEKATPKKKQDARKRGNVLSSIEVTTAFCCAVMFAYMYLLFPAGIDQLNAIFKDFLSAEFIYSDVTLDIGFLQWLYFEVLKRLAITILPTLGVALLSGVIINIAQVGFLFSTEPLQPKLDKLSPIAGFKRMFSSRSFVQLIKSIIKVIVLGYILYSEYIVLLEKFPTLMGANIYKTIIEVIKTAFWIALKMSLALAIIAAFDYLYAWWKHEKDLMMTKQEVKDEYKNIEGDPQIKGKIRQKQRQMSVMRMMQQVPSADVVITNPTHYAIALKYEEGMGTSAPVVLAKGKDFIAGKIKEAARENRIEIVENKPLAQALYSMCEVGDEIPPELYQAVADILVYVYRQKQNIRPARAL